MSTRNVKSNHTLILNIKINEYIDVNKNISIKVDVSALS